MTLRMEKLKKDLYIFNTQPKDSPTYAETEYFASRYGMNATWLVSSTLDPGTLISEHPTLADVKKVYGQVDNLEPVG